MLASDRFLSNRFNVTNSRCLRITLFLNLCYMFSFSFLSFYDGIYVQGRDETRTNITKTNILNYTDDTGLYSLQYPFNWTVEYEEPKTRFDAYVTYFDIDEEHNNVIVAIDDDNYNNVESFPDDIENRPSYLKGEFSDAEMIDFGLNVYTIDKYDTYTIMFERSQVSESGVKFKIKQMSISTQIENKHLEVTYTTHTDDFDKYIDDVETMIDSIRINKNKAFSDLE